MNMLVDEHAAHAIFAPSSAERWIECTASAEGIAALGEQEEGEEAKKGTAAHDEIERILGPYSGSGMGLWLESTDSMIEPVDPDHPSAYGIALMVDYVRQLPPGRLWVEERVRLTEHIWGRCDICHFEEATGILTIVDFKNGFVGVDVEENPQLRIYAAGSIYTHKLPVKWIRYVVVQPNDFRPVPKVKQWGEKPEALHAWASRVAAIPLGPKAFVAGEQCTYCPLFGRCSASRDLLANVGALVAGLMSPEQVSPAQRALFLACAKPIKDAFSKAEKAWLKEALAGGTAGEGLGVFTSAKHRAWKDEAAARKVVFEAKGIEGLKAPTPAQAEEMGIDIEGLADKPEGGPVLGFASDKRKPWAPKTAAEMFAGVPGVGA